MPIIQRADKDQDAKDMDYFGGFFADGESPFWVTKDRALDCENAPEVARSIHSRYGYRLVVGSNYKAERELILYDMKHGKITKEQGIEKLRSL